MEPVQTAIAALLYPGLLTALLVGIMFGVVVQRRRAFPSLSAAGSREGLAAVASVLVVGFSLALLPWPFHPAPVGTNWLWAWAGFELAFLLPLLPPLITGIPSVVRAAIREAQLGTLSRACLWAVLAPALVLHADWGRAGVAAHLLALVVALAALPAAIGWSVFGAETSVTPDGTLAGLPRATALLNTWAHDVRSGALIAAAMVATLPVAVGSAWTGVLVVVAGYATVLLALRRLAGQLPRMPLPAALQLFARWALPAAAVVALAVGLAAQG